LLALALGACRAVVNYQSPVGPRYIGLPASVAVPLAAGSSSHALRVVTYNVQWGKHIDRAISVLKTRLPLPDADIIVLQEMDADGTRRIADALGMAWVYYPAAVHPKLGHDFGNAVLSRWPIVADEKLMLPHIGGLRHAQRIATAATVMVGTVPVRVYSAHLGTPSDIRPSKRRDQADMILADAAAYPLVIVAGDMNSHGIGKEFVVPAAGERRRIGRPHGARRGRVELDRAAQDHERLPLLAVAKEERRRLQQRLLLRGREP
jgi:endonuclease/exonuclease/phosphatase family metal-dependent hydrolase